MRVSTAQFYFQNTRQITNQQSDVNKQIEYLASGKRVITAKDDAVAFGTLTGYKNEISNLDKYQRNMIQAEGRNNLQETSFATAESVMQEFKQLLIQANNGTLSDLDLGALSDIAKGYQDQMLDVANAKDETGGYVFSGYQIDVEPFAMQLDNSVVYQGDNGVRELQIAKNVMVDINQTGEAAFEKVNNVTGDFSANYNVNTSGISLNKATIVDRGAYDTTTNPPDYNFNFTSATDLTVTDSLGAVVFNTAAYVSGQTIAFNGVEVQLSGNPLPFDNFDLTPEENISIFDTLKSAIDWMDVGVSPVDPIQHSVDYKVLLGQIDSALNHMVSNRTEAGVRLQLIDSQANINMDASLVLNKGQSRIEDLDFAKAVAEFEQSKVALQAAQQTFAKIKDLSLFNYI